MLGFFYSLAFIILTGLIALILNIGTTNDTMASPNVKTQLIKAINGLNVKKSKSSTMRPGAKRFNDSIKTSLAKSINTK